MKMALLIYPIHLPVEVNSKIVYIFLIVCFTIRCSGGSKALLHFILSHDGLKRLLMLCYSPTAQILINDVNINLGPTAESRALNCDLPLCPMLFFSCVALTGPKPVSMCRPNLCEYFVFSEYINHVPKRPCRV